MLYIYVVESVYSREPIPHDDEATAKYLAGALFGLVMLAQHGALMTLEGSDFWIPYIWHYAPCKPIVSLLGLTLRIVMSWMVNQFFAEMAFIMLPVVLLDSSNSLEFVDQAELAPIENPEDIEDIEDRHCSGCRFGCCRRRNKNEGHVEAPGIGVVGTASEKSVYRTQIPWASCTNSECIFALRMLDQVFLC